MLAEERTPDGVVLTLGAVEWAHLVRWLLSFEAEVTVLCPESLRELLVTAATETAAHHAKKARAKSLLT